MGRKKFCRHQKSNDGAKVISFFFFASRYSIFSVVDLRLLLHWNSLTRFSFFFWCAEFSVPTITKKVSDDCDRAVDMKRMASCSGGCQAARSQCPRQYVSIAHGTYFNDVRIPPRMLQGIFPPKGLFPSNKINTPRAMSDDIYPYCKGILGWGAKGSADTKPRARGQSNSKRGGKSTIHWK